MSDLPAVDRRNLFERIRNAEPGAVRDLYRTFRDGMRLMFSRSLRTQEVEDRVHDTFLIVVDAIQRGLIQNQGCLAGFIRGVIKNNVASHLKATAAFRAKQENVECADLRACRPNPEEDAARRERGARMQTVLLSMSPRDREVLIRFYLQEQPQEQIQAEMGLTLTQFRLIRSRAKARFGERARARLAQSRPMSVEWLSPRGLHSVV